MLVKLIRNRTSTIVVIYSFYPYLLGLSLRNTSKALVVFRDEKSKSYCYMELDTKIWFSTIYKRKRVSAFIIDETVIQIGSQHFWL